MIQVRPTFVREAALLLADLAEQPGKRDVTQASSFLEALYSKLDVSTDWKRQRRDGQPTMQPSAPFLAQLVQDQPLQMPASLAIGAYGKRLEFGLTFEGLHWPVDIEI